MRGLRNLMDEKGNAQINQDYFLNRTKRDYFSATQEPPEIFTGLSFFEYYRKMLLGSYVQRKWVQAFEELIRDTFFPNRLFTIIPSEDRGGTLNVKIGAEKERPISDLGDGIHSLIMLTFPLFRYAEEEMLFFFEERSCFG